MALTVFSIREIHATPPRLVVLARTIPPKSPKPPPITKHVCGVDATQGAPGGARGRLPARRLSPLRPGPRFLGEVPTPRTGSGPKKQEQAELKVKVGEVAEEKPAQAQLLGGFYDALVAVVRPPRFEYDPRLLGRRPSPL